MGKLNIEALSNTRETEVTIKGTKYKVTIDSKIPEDLNVEDFIERFHTTREKVYSELGRECSVLELSVSIIRSFDHGYQADWYQIPAFFGEDGVRHEVVHEVQDHHNLALKKWSSKRWSPGLYKRSEKASKILSVFEELEKEGFATFVSKSPDFTFSEENAKCLRKGLNEIESDDFYLDVFEQNRVEYTLGNHIFEIIQKAGFDPVEVGLTRNPISMLKAYEEACNKLDLKPYVTVKDFSTAYGKVFGVTSK